MTNSMVPDQTAPIGAVCSGSMPYASILNSFVMFCNYLQQKTSADDIFRCIFFLALYGLLHLVLLTSNFMEGLALELLRCKCVKKLQNANRTKIRSWLDDKSA